MNRAIPTLVAAAAILGAPLALAQDRSTGEAIDDTSIAAQTKMELIDDPTASAGDINIETYKGEVQLIGFVDSEEAKTAALAKAKTVEGVTKVSDALIVAEGDRSMGRAIDDETIHTRIKYEIAKVGMGEAVDVVVKVREGEVLLGGYVDDDATRASVAEAAQAVDGVTGVHNKLNVRM